MAGYKHDMKGFSKLIYDNALPEEAKAQIEANKQAQARKMYEDAMANNALLQDMRNRAAQKTVPVQNAMTGVTNSIANTALQSAGVDPAMAGGAIRSNYQGS